MSLTTGFTFFAVMTTWALMMSEIPIVGEIIAFAFPLLVIVSGWRYALYFLGITMLADLPDWIQGLGLVASQARIMSDAFNSGVLPATQIPSYVSPMMQAASPFVLLGVLFLMLWGLPTYIRIIRHVKKLVAFRNYRRYS